MPGQIRISKVALQGLWRDQRLAALYVYLLDHADADGAVNTTMTQIAADMKVAPYTIRRLLMSAEMQSRVQLQLSFRNTLITVCGATACTTRAQPRVQPNVQPNVQPRLQAAKHTVTVAEPIAPAFVAPGFAPAFAAWLGYKRQQFKFTYKSEASMRAAYAELVRLSGNDPQTAMRIVEQSMSNGWKGLFELKSNNRNGTNDRYTIGNPASAADRQRSRDEMRALATGIVAGSADRLQRLYDGCLPDPKHR